MNEWFKNVMKTVDNLEHLEHLDRRITVGTPFTVEEVVRKMYHEQGLPLDESLLQKALVVENSVCVPQQNPPQNPPRPRPADVGLNLLDVGLIYGAIAILAILAVLIW